jgi:hypothetical protein
MADRRPGAGDQVEDPLDLGDGERDQAQVTTRQPSQDRKSSQADDHETAAPVHPDHSKWLKASPLRPGHELRLPYYDQRRHGMVHRASVADMLIR